MRLSKGALMRLTGAGIATGLAGCQTTDPDDGTEPEPPDVDGSGGGESTLTDGQDADLEVVDTHDLTTLPIVGPDTLDDMAGVELEITDPDGLQDVAVAYTDDHRAEPVVVAQETAGAGDTDAGGQTMRVTGEFPQRMLEPTTGEFTVNVTDASGTTQTISREIDDLNGSYRIDRKRKANTDAELEDIGNYTTERSWDDSVTNTQELRDSQGRVLEEQAYTPLVNQVMSGKDFETGGNVYPNYGEANNRGFFDQDEVENEESFEMVLRWYLPAIMDHDDENYGTAPSSRFERFGATMRKLINQHQSDAEAKVTGVNSLPEHGIFGVQDTK